MNNDPASLENLRDIVVPPPVPWWPPAPGWWIVFAMLLVTVAVFGFRAWRSWHANAYRRQALRELRGVTSVAKMAEILKRTALCAYPRTDIAALSGTAWCQWLEQTGGRPVPENIAQALTRDLFAKPENVNDQEVSLFAAEWINRHERRTADLKGSKAI